MENAIPMACRVHSLPSMCFYIIRHAIIGIEMERILRSIKQTQCRMVNRIFSTLKVVYWKTLSNSIFQTTFSGMVFHLVYTSQRRILEFREWNIALNWTSFYTTYRPYLFCELHIFNLLLAYRIWRSFITLFIFLILQLLCVKYDVYGILMNYRQRLWEKSVLNKMKSKISHWTLHAQKEVADSMMTSRPS